MGKFPPLLSSANYVVVVLRLLVETTSLPINRSEDGGGSSLLADHNATPFSTRFSVIESRDWQTTPEDTPCADNLSSRPDARTEFGTGRNPSRASPFTQAVALKAVPNMTLRREITVVYDQ